MSARAGKSGTIRDLRVKPQRDIIEIGKRQLTAEHLAAARNAIFLIEHHKTIISDIEQGLFANLKASYGVDLSQGQWQININTGELTQAPAQPAHSNNGE